MAWKKGRHGMTYRAHLSASPSLLPRSETPAWEGFSLSQTRGLFKLVLHLQPFVWAEDSWVGQAASAELGMVLHPLLPPSGLACGCHRQPPRLLTFLPCTKKGPSQRPDWFPGREMGHFRKGLAAGHSRAVSTEHQDRYPEQAFDKSLP